MKNRHHVRIAVPALSLLALAASPAFAQDAGGDAPPPVVVQLPAAPAPEVVVPGYPAPGTNLEAHLPSSSQSLSDTSSSADGFDLLPSGGASGSMHGNESGSYVIEGQYLPNNHSVRRGDTLWEISELYTRNAYNWPRIWALNPQIQNPNWIYPGDRVRLRAEGDASSRGTFGSIGRPRTVAPETVFLRDMGWIDDTKEDNWGELVGSPDDQMLLSQGDDVYIRIDDDHDIAIGQSLSIFRPLRSISGGFGKLVSIRGTARVDRYNPKTHMVRAKLVESLDVIERGDRIGPLGTPFAIVPPKTNDRDLEVRILAAIYPLQLFGEQQALFLDKGEEDGLVAGNRLFAVRRGDRWEDSIGEGGSLAGVRARIEDDRPAQIEDPELNGDSDLYPDETYAELRVVRVRAHTALAIVTAATGEVERNARLVTRQGY